MPSKGKGKGKGKSSKADRKAAAVAGGRAKAAERRRRKQEAMDRRKDKYCSDMVKMKRELAAVGLSVREVPGDGNCLFRAVSDQMEGTQEGHWDLRCRAAAFMESHREDFEPFVDTDEFGSWEEYVEGMASMGEWGGNMELIALSRSLGVNVCVHQLGEPRWEVTHFGPRRRRVHVSFHDGNHYNSVRAAGDDGSGRAAPFSLATGRAEEAECEEPEEAAEGGEWSAAERRVSEGMGGSAPMGAVREALAAAGGDEDAALTLLVTGEVGADMGAADSAAAARVSPAGAGGGGGGKAEGSAGAARAGTGGGAKALSRKEAKAAKRRAKAARRLAEAAAGGGGGPSGGGRKAKSKGKNGRAEEAAADGPADAAASSLAAVSI